VCASNPEVGLLYLVDMRFLAQKTADVAQFLRSRKGLSKKSVGEYVSSRRSLFNVQVLE